ncbi:HD domain-containing protein [bacterium]|nr:HD domain-containing protein [bacterium]
MRKPEPQPIQPKLNPEVRQAEVRPELHKPEPQPVQPKPHPEVRKPEPQPIQPKLNPEVRQAEVRPELHKPEPQPVQPKPDPELRKPEPQPVQPKTSPEVRQTKVQPELRKPDPQPVQPKPHPEVRKPEPQPFQPKINPEVRQTEVQPEPRKPDPQPVQPKPHPEVRKPEPQPIQPKLDSEGRKPELRHPEPELKTLEARAQDVPRPDLKSPLEAAKAQKVKEAKAEEARAAALKAETARAAPAEELLRAKEEATTLPLANQKPLNALRTLAPVSTVKAATLEKGGEARTKYPEWLQVKLSQDATPAYMTSLPGQQRTPKPVETQPLTLPAQAVDALSKADFRRTDELREISSQQQKTVEAIAQPAPPATAPKATQLFQAVVGQGLMAPQKPPQDAPKSQESQRRSHQEEQKDKERGISPVAGASVSSLPGAGRVSGKSEIIESRGMGAVLSGSVGKRDGADAGYSPPPPVKAPESPVETQISKPLASEQAAPQKTSRPMAQEKPSLPNVAAGWGDAPAPDNGARLSSGRVATAESPIYSPVLDDLANRLKQGKPLPPVTNKEPERPLFFDQSEDHHSRLRDDDARLERLEKSGALVQAFHQAEASNNTKKREEGPPHPSASAGGAVEEVNDHSNRGGGSGGSGGQQRERDQQGGQSAQHLQDQQHLQSQRRTQSDTKMELQRLEAYRLAKTDEALKVGLRMSHQPEGKQLAELMNRHAGHSMESLLKKAYRLDSLGELSRDDAVNALGLVLKLGGEFTFAHSARVLELAMDLADEVGLSDKKTRSQVQLGALLKDTGEMALMLDQAPPNKLEKMSDWLGSQDLRQAGLLHDIGKTRIPPEILYKPGKLTDEEYELMKLHPIIGEQMIYPIESLRHLCPTVRGHHEKWDGSGYPDGLKGEDIPYAARIIAIADVFDALHAERPYKAGMPVERVQAILREGRGTHFDPDLLDAFERVIQRRHPELSNPFA